jgi:hypothetical protein
MTYYQLIKQYYCSLSYPKTCYGARIFQCAISEMYEGILQKISSLCVAFLLARKKNKPTVNCIQVRPTSQKKITIAGVIPQSPCDFKWQALARVS